LYLWVTMQHSLQRSFGRAARHYTKAARFQPVCAQALLNAVARAVPPHRILDLGCGVGMGTSLLQSRWTGASVWSADFSLPMLRLMDGPAAAFCARAEALPLADGVVDFVWSNLALQWCDAAAFALEVERVLMPGGAGAISTLGPGTFPELAQAFAGVDGRSHTQPFADAGTVVEAFAAAGLSVRLEVRPMTIHFSDLSSLLFSIRGVGANHYSGQGGVRLGKQAYACFRDSYEALRGSEGLPLTYEVFMVFVEKP
jgi:malonyl-CoA O-methyltransferase